MHHDWTRAPGHSELKLAVTVIVPHAFKPAAAAATPVFRPHILRDDTLHIEMLNRFEHNITLMEYF